MYTLSATKLLLDHVFVAGVHEPLRQEANTVALLQPSDSPNAGQPHRYDFPKRSFGNKTIVYCSFRAKLRGLIDPCVDADGCTIIVLEM